MTKRYWSSLLLFAALAAPGCRMCCPSYDYCGPTEPGESNSEYCGMDRRGSILSGLPTYAEGATYVDEGTIIEEYEGAQPLLSPPSPPTPMKQPAPPSLDGPSARRTR
jgi:hypothetical protein